MADQKSLVFRNRIVDKGQLRKLIAWTFTNYGTARSAAMADRLKDLGFRYATKAGVSISVDDLMVPPSKRTLLEAAEEEIRTTEVRYQRGEITEVERFQKVIDTWNSTSEALKDQVVSHFKDTNPLNSVYMMAFSGARGNISQVRQLVGMRGLMADPQGEIIDLPIKTNFREGLTVTEYIISSYGARKGLVDTALRTADSGYLTRRLVDVSQDVIIREIDCGTDRGISTRAMKDGERTMIPLSSRLLGRVPTHDIVHPQSGEILVNKNEPMSDEMAVAVDQAGVEEVIVRSPLTCSAARSVCQHCYGWSLAHAQLVDLGEAVGIIAAQSIGEPGTQLTMRTFHTGGVFTGEVARQVRSPQAGTVRIPKTLRTRPFRTRHGEEAMFVEANGNMLLDLKVEEATSTQNSGKGDSAGRPSKTQNSVEVPLTQGSTLYVVNGQQLKAGQLVAEVAIGARSTRAHTEKATRDIASDLAGEVKFADVLPEEKTDRQGNTTTTAARGGLIWILSGEVYNLPPGAEPVVTNGDHVTDGSVLAETRLNTVHGGIVRLPETTGSGKGGREVEIITASVVLDEATVRVEHGQGRDQYLIETANHQSFSLLATPGTKVQNNQVVAELIDEQYRTTTGGLLKYAGVEVAKKGKAKQGYEVVQGGTLLWIPEESHEVNKDISLLLVEDAAYVEAGTEVVKDIFCQNSGVVEVTQKNDILRELVVKPGELLMVDDPESVLGRDGTFGQPGEEILPGHTLTELRYIEFIESPDGPALLLRPVTEFAVMAEPPVPSTQSSTGKGRSIQLRAIQRLPYKDSERVKSVDGVELLRTQLVLEIEQDMSEHGGVPLAADIELLPDPTNSELQRLQLVILESLVIRRDIAADATQGSTQTRLLVEDGQSIAPGAVVARTEIQCKETGTIRGIREAAEAIRRVLVLRENDLFTLTAPAQPKARPGDLVVAGSEIAPGVFTETSGQVVSVKRAEGTEGEIGAEGERVGETLTLASSTPSASSAPSAPSAYTITLRTARPYRVSPGAVLQVEDGGLVQRGDNLVLLVFERAKTGDIIQGLPRIEELLEARKPKEACILAKRPGKAEVARVEDETVEIKVIESDGVTEYPIGPGQNVVLSDGDIVDAGTPLTDGPANPHEILDIFFNLDPTLGTYPSATEALSRVQTFLVNEVQLVYQSQGIDIADKHIEVIVRQMTSKVRIDDGGDTTMLPGELVELRQVEQVNDAMSITGGAKADYTPVLLGITKASLNTDSFISAASFQETTRVLTEAAIEGKSDWLRGLKENVIIGRLIPAGTGFNAYEDVSIASEDLDLANGLFDEVDDPLDVVLDDRTARAYNLDGSMGEAALGFEPGPSAILDEDDELLIDDGVEDLEDDDDDEYEDDEDDEE